MNFTHCGGQLNKFMKIALCFSGHLRNGDHTSFPNLKRIILDNYDCDTFISSWDINAFSAQAYRGMQSYDTVEKDDKVHERLINTYKPKKFNIETGKPQWLIDIENKWGNKKVKFPELNGSAFVAPIQAMFKKIEDVDVLRRQYELENNFKYDLVVRIRFDIYPIDDFIHSTRHIWENKNVVVTKPDLNPDAVRDILFFGNSDIMSLATSCFSMNSMNETNYDKFINAEHVLRHHMISNNINHEKTELIKYILNIRPQTFNELK